MVIHTDSSIVPDSTVSSSPSTPVSPVVKRATFTYGRRKDLQSVLDPDSSATIADSSSSSRPSLYSAGHSDVEEEIPSSSHASGIPELSGVTLAEVDAGTFLSFTRKKDEDKEIGNNSIGGESPISPARNDDAGSSSFQFAWKAKLKLIDEDFDDLDQSTVPPGHPNGLHILGSKDTDVPVSLASQPSSPKGTQLPTTDDVFGGSLSTLTDSQLQSASTFDASRSATPDLGVVKKLAVVYSDDDLADSSFDSPANMPHPINTPKSWSTPTPPTSEPAAKPQSKGKGKAPARSVPPLVFDDDPERSLETSHVKKSIQKGRRTDRESRSTIKVFMIWSSIDIHSGH